MKISLGFGAALLAVVSWNGLAQTPLPPPKGVPVPSTTVTSVAPASMSLIVGNPAQKVVLTGTLLDRITAADIERNGVAVPYIAVTLQPVASTTQRDLFIAAVNGAKPGTGPADLVVSGRLSGGLLQVSLKVPVQLDVTGQVLVHRDALFGTPINSLLGGASASFTSCGTPSQHVFSVALPKVAYAVNGTVPRLEQITSPLDRVAFMADHSLNPSNAFDITKLVNLPTTGHPSPIVHSISEVRMCLEPLPGSGSWAFSGATQTASGIEAKVTVGFSTALFRVRGMPSDPTGLITGINVGILWGSALTDTELADFVYMKPEFDVRLPLTVSNGRLAYSSALLTPRNAGAGWSSKFLGPGNIVLQLQSYAAARVGDVGQELQKAFNATATKNAISNAIMAQLQSAHGVSTVLGVTLSTTPDTWAIQYR